MAPACSIKKEEEKKQKTQGLNNITSLKSLAIFLTAKDNARNIMYMTEVPDICQKQPCMLGVDEAGHGPVLRPMVYGIAYCPLVGKQALHDLGCADSKQLQEEKRNNIFEEMNKAAFARESVGWAVKVISPNVISMTMYRRAKCSLNEVSINSAIGLIKSAAIYVDTVGPPEKNQAKLKALFPQYGITVAKKADSTYPIVCGELLRAIMRLKSGAFPRV